LLGALLTTAGLLIPCATCAYLGARWCHRNRALAGVRAFKLCMAPIIVALLVATSWILTSAHDSPSADWPVWLLTLGTITILACIRVHLLWLIGFGALLGWAGYV
jgi:chromate transporter